MTTIIYRNSDTLAIGKTIGNVIRIVDMSTMGQRVRQVRIERGWAQPELARRAKVKQSVISAIENGQPGTPFIVEIADALGVSVYWLRSKRGPKNLTEWQDFGKDLSEAEQEAVKAHVRYLRASKVA